MPYYRYRAVADDGRLVEGEGEFVSLEDLIIKLSSQNLTLISVSEAKHQTEGKSLEIKLPSFFGKVSDRDWSLLARQLSVLISAGVSLVEALELISDQILNKRLKRSLLEVAKDIEEGSSFHAALQKRKDIFPEFIVNLVAVGEETGELDLVLRRVADYYEKIAFIKGKIKSASFYPSFVMLFATLLVWGILTFVVPKFADIYKSLGGELPWPTQLLMNISLTLQQNLHYIFGSIILITFSFSILYKSNLSFREAVHKLLLKIPKFGELFRKSAFARFSRTLSTLYSSGVSVERSLEITAKVVGFIPIEKSIGQAKKEVLEGKTLWMALQKTGTFPKMVVAMVRVGEETGNIDEMLNSIANFYEEEVDRMIEGLISLVEPLLIVILGVIIGAILIALYLPIFNVGSLIIR